MSTKFVLIIFDPKKPRKNYQFFDTYEAMFERKVLLAATWPDLSLFMTEIIDTRLGRRGPHRFNLIRWVLRWFIPRPN